MFFNQIRNLLDLDLEVMGLDEIDDLLPLIVLQLLHNLLESLDAIVPRHFLVQRAELRF